MICIQPTDHVTAEGKYLAKGKVHFLATFLRGGPIPGYGNTVAFFDETLEIDDGMAFKSFIFDFGVKCFFAVNSLVAV